MVSTQNGATALYFASQGHVTVVRLLLEKGADVNICNKVVMDFVLCVHVCGHSVIWLYVTYVVCMYFTQRTVSLLCLSPPCQLFEFGFWLVFWSLTSRIGERP